MPGRARIPFVQESSDIRALVLRALEADAFVEEDAHNGLQAWQRNRLQH